MADEKIEYRVEGQRWYEKPLSQGAKRTGMQLTDQFGRPWDTVFDMTAKPRPAPCSTISPAGWHDPLYTPEKYKRYDPANMNALYIDVDAWIRDSEKSNDDWNQLLIDTAAEMSPSDGGASLLGKGGADIAPALLRKVGRRPQPVEPIKALKAGNKYVAGLSIVMPEWARPYFAKAVEVEKEYADAEFPDADDEGAEKYADLEEAVDPEATGGKKVNPRRAKKVA